MTLLERLHPLSSVHALLCMPLHIGCLLAETECGDSDADLRFLGQHQH